MAESENVFNPLEVEAQEPPAVPGGIKQPGAAMETHEATFADSYVIELDLDNLPGKPPLRFGRMRKEHLERLVEPCARARRAGDQQRLLAAGEELGVEQEKGQGAEMIAVEM